MELKTIIVEDELLSSMFLGNLLTEFCPQVQVIAKATGEDEAVEFINALQPDLVFLDIELQQGTGFNVLKRINCPQLQVIFATAFDHYGIKAIRFSGVDYLLKPIDIDALQKVIENAAAKKHSNAGSIAIAHLLQSVENNFTPSSLPLHSTGKVEYINLEDIIRIEVYETGSNFILKAGRKILVTRNLKEYELLLAGHHFFRIHTAHIINTREISNLTNNGEALVLMTDNTSIPISAKKKEELDKILSRQIQ